MSGVTSMVIGARKKLICLLLSGTSLIPSGALAETTLRALDGSFEMKGQSVTFDESSYFLQTPQGELVVQREFVTCIGDGCPVDETVENVDDRIILTSLDGSFELNGTLLQVTASDFVVQTGDGSVTIQREFVRCEGAACPTSEVDRADFKIAVGDTLAAELLSKVITDFAESKDFSVTLSMGGADQISTILVGDERGQEVANISLEQIAPAEAIAAVQRGEAAFALTQGTLSATDEDDDTDATLTETTIGLDGIAFVVHPENRINVLEMEDLRSVLTGGVTNWSDLGGADAPIAVHVLAESSGANAQLRNRLLSGQALSTGVRVHDTAVDLNTAIGADPYAIGAVYRSQIIDSKPLDLVSSCNIFFDNSDFSIQTEEYPLTIRWNQYMADDDAMPEFAKNIGDFIVTDFGQRSVASQGLVAQELRVLPIKDQGARILTSVLAGDATALQANVTRAYLGETANAERLSTSLRFLTGSSQLDQKAIDDVKRISSVVRSDAYEGYEVLIFGFTDSVGSDTNNITLAERRANAVRDILLAENVGFLDDDVVSTFGMGPIAPVDCNDTAEGRELNRRVEIWIRPKA
ncbi:phosphate ABC transporter substrate-binding/OmpA family protein [Yoonia sp. 2307UL14-13]|uniref:phosphate ABC transporter substrate-binding/OmpA family protein n=1 Tax=Yoonia sp. 2307UL14-13 TaxID=3126506 RepID=UPI0030A00FF8